MATAAAHEIPNGTVSNSIKKKEKEEEEIEELTVEEYFQKIRDARYNVRLAQSLLDRRRENFEISLESLGNSINALSKNAEEFENAKLIKGVQELKDVAQRSSSLFAALLLQQNVAELKQELQQAKDMVDRLEN